MDNQGAGGAHLSPAAFRPIRKTRNPRRRIGARSPEAVSARRIGRTGALRKTPTPDRTVPKEFS
jgi:hypothetical protein